MELIFDKLDNLSFSEKSRPCVKKIYKAKCTFEKKKSKQIRYLKTKTTTKLHSNVKIFILQMYSWI